jgi:hypothetical protein
LPGKETRHRRSTSLLPVSTRRRGGPWTLNALQLADSLLQRSSTLHTGSKCPTGRAFAEAHGDFPPENVTRDAYVCLAAIMSRAEQRHDPGLQTIAPLYSRCWLAYRANFNGIMPGPKTAILPIDL